MKKQLFEFFPILLFFIAFKLYDIYVATAVVIVATLVQVGYSWFKYHEVKTMQWVMLGLVLVMGGATLYLHDERFIKLKLTFVEWMFGIALLGSQYIGAKTFFERMMGEIIELPKLVYRRWNMIWAFFLIAIGFLNLYVMDHYNTDDWVTFKTVGVPVLMVLFAFVQMLFLYKYLPEIPETEE